MSSTSASSNQLTGEIPSRAGDVDDVPELEPVENSKSHPTTTKPAAAPKPDKHKHSESGLIIALIRSRDAILRKSAILDLAIAMAEGSAEKAAERLKPLEETDAYELVTRFLLEFHAFLRVIASTSEIPQGFFKSILVPTVSDLKPIVGPFERATAGSDNTIAQNWKLFEERVARKDDN